jgi:hypothetical protein
MDLDTQFRIANLVALAGWIALAAAPLARPRLIAAARVMGAALALGYLTLFIVSLSGGAGGLAGFDYTPAGIAKLFARPEAAFIGWVHYLAFDLWVGAWEAEDAAKRGLPHALLLPCLFLTFMVGPIGLLCYLALRAAKGRRAA